MEKYSCNELVDLISKYLNQFEQINEKLSIKEGEKLEARYDPEARALLKREIEGLLNHQRTITTSIARGLSVLRRKGCTLQHLI